MATEKSQQNLIHGIEGFDATKLKHAQTQEKNPLPDKDGMCLDFIPLPKLSTLNLFFGPLYCFHSHRAREGANQFHQWHRAIRLD